MKDFKGKSVDFNEVLELIRNANGEPCVIKNARIKSLDPSEGFTVKGLSFENVTFENCLFSYPVIKGCSFRECKFVGCHFFDSIIRKNLFELCEAKDIVLDNNTYVNGNVFDGLTGNLSKPYCLSNSGNFFKNMDFSGFLKLYESARWGDGEIVWFKNYFYNTTVELSAIEELSRNAKYFWTGDHSFDKEDIVFFNHDGFPIYDMDTRPFVKGRKQDIPAASEIYKPADFLVDIRSMDEEKKINLLANLVVNLPEGYTFGIDDSEAFASLSRVQLYSKSNPLPAHIIDSRVNRYASVKESSIKPIDINTPIVSDDKYPMYTIYDGRIIEGYTEENNLHNPANYEQYGKKLILIDKKD